MAEKVQPAVATIVRLVQAADQGIPLQAEGAAADVVQVGQQFRRMGLRPVVQSAAAVDEAHDQKIGFGRQHLGHRQVRRQHVEHVAFDIQAGTGIADLDHHRARPFQRHPINIADAPAAQRSGLDRPTAGGAGYRFGEAGLHGFSQELRMSRSNPCAASSTRS